MQWTHWVQTAPWRPLRLLIGLAIILLLLGLIYWGATHRPTRELAGPEPELGIAGQSTQPVTVVPAAENEVLVYTIDRQDVCPGERAGDVGYSLRCMAPAGVYLFRVVLPDGRTVLATRLNEQILIRVGPE